MKKNLLESKMTSISRAKKTIKRLRSLITKHELKAEQKLDENNLDLSTLKREIKYVKNITSLKSVEFKDLSFSSCSHLPIRTPGDGCETTSCIKSFRTSGYGKETSFVAPNIISLNTGFISHHHESEKRNRKIDLNKCVVFENDYLSFTDDVSFNKDNRGSEVDINAQDMNFLNECMIYEDDDESVFEDDSDCESICELEMNILETCEDNTKLGTSQIKAMFTKTDLNARLINEDDSMESFMNTFYRD